MGALNPANWPTGLLTIFIGNFWDILNGDCWDIPTLALAQNQGSNSRPQIGDLPVALPVQSTWQRPCGKESARTNGKRKSEMITSNHYYLYVILGHKTVEIRRVSWDTMMITGQGIYLVCSRHRWLADYDLWPCSCCSEVMIGQPKWSGHFVRISIGDHCHSWICEVLWGRDVFSQDVWCNVM